MRPIQEKPKNEKDKKRKKRNRKNGRHTKDSLKNLCWGILPLGITLMMVLDGLGIYAFTTERLLLLGALLLIVLLPFFNEITVKDLSVRRMSEKQEKDP